MDVQNTDVNSSNTQVHDAWHIKKEHETRIMNSNKDKESVPQCP